MTPIEKIFKDYDKARGTMRIAVLKIKVMDEIERIRREQKCSNCRCASSGCSNNKADNE